MPPGSVQQSPTILFCLAPQVPLSALCLSIKHKCLPCLNLSALSSPLTHEAALFPWGTVWAREQAMSVHMHKGEGPFLPFQESAHFQGKHLPQISPLNKNTGGALLSSKPSKVQ